MPEKPVKPPLCPKCSCADPANFAKHARRRNGLQPYCRDCMKVLQTAWKYKNFKLAKPRKPLNAWDAILKSERLTMEHGSSIGGKTLMYEHMTVPEGRAIASEGYQSPLEIEIYAGLYGTDSEYYAEVKAALDSWKR